jgi:hypothetical protein
MVWDVGFMRMVNRVPRLGCRVCRSSRVLWNWNPNVAQRQTVDIFHDAARRRGHGIAIEAGG